MLLCDFKKLNLFQKLLFLSILQSVTDKIGGQLETAITPLYLGGRQKWMIPSCFPWKVVIFFGKELVIWSNISGVMIGLSWQIKFGKFHYLFCSCFSNFDFSTSSYHNTTFSGPIDMFFTKKCNYFSWGTRWNHPFWSQSL